jgi:L-lactate dehydrogenase complex protein LldG
MGQREEIIAREEMLKKIRQALLVSKENPFEGEDLNADVFVKSEDIPELDFAKKLIEAGGSFVFCEDMNDFFTQFNALAKEKNWRRFRIGNKTITDFLNLPADAVILPENCTGEETGITQCDYLAARTGSIVISTEVCTDRLAWSFCSTHLVIATTVQVVENLTKAYALLKEKYKDKFPSLVSVITGPSRTADIEKQLVMGAHGPSEVIVFLIDQV